jgi:predicted RNA methylase
MPVRDTPRRAWRSKKARHAVANDKLLVELSSRSTDDDISKYDDDVFIRVDSYAPRVMPHGPGHFLVHSDTFDDPPRAQTCYVIPRPWKRDVEQKGADFPFTCRLQDSESFSSRDYAKAARLMHESYRQLCLHIMKTLPMRVVLVGFQDAPVGKDPKILDLWERVTARITSDNQCHIPRGIIRNCSLAKFGHPDFSGLYSHFHTASSWQDSARTAEIVEFTLRANGLRLAVVDLCCGIGANTIAFLERGSLHVRAYDNDSLCVGATRQNWNRVCTSQPQVQLGNGVAILRADKFLKSFDPCAYFLDPPWVSGWKDTRVLAQFGGMPLSDVISKTNGSIYFLKVPKDAHSQYVSKTPAQQIWHLRQYSIHVYSDFKLTSKLERFAQNSPLRPSRVPRGAVGPSPAGTGLAASISPKIQHNVDGKAGAARSIQNRSGLPPLPNPLPVPSAPPAGPAPPALPAVPVVRRPGRFCRDYPRGLCQYVANQACPHGAHDVPNRHHVSGRFNDENFYIPDHSYIRTGGYYQSSGEYAAQHPISVGSIKACEFLKEKLNHPARLVPLTNPHWEAAAVRHHNQLNLIHRLVTMGRRAGKHVIHVNVPWDHGRFRNACGEWNRLKAAHLPEIRVYDTMPNITSRNFILSANRIPDNFHPEGYTVLYDVYFVTPASFAQFLRRGNGQGLVYCMQFDGVMGYGNFQAWRKVSETEVLCHPDFQQAPYRHPTLKWLDVPQHHLFGGQFLHSVFLAGHHDKFLYQLVLDHNQAIGQESSRPNRSITEPFVPAHDRLWETYDGPFGSHWYIPWFTRPESGFMFTKKATDFSSMSLISVSRNQKIGYSHVEREFDKKNPAYTSMSRAFGRDYEIIRRNTQRYLEYLSEVDLAGDRRYQVSNFVSSATVQQVLQNAPPVSTYLVHAKELTQNVALLLIIAYAGRVLHRSGLADTPMAAVRSSLRFISRSHAGKPTRPEVKMILSPFFLSYIPDGVAAKHWKAVQRYVQGIRPSIKRRISSVRKILDNPKCALAISVASTFGLLSGPLAIIPLACAISKFYGLCEKETTIPVGSLVSNGGLHAIRSLTQSGSVTIEEATIVNGPLCEIVYDNIDVASSSHITMAGHRIVGELPQQDPRPAVTLLLGTNGMLLSPGRGLVSLQCAMMMRCRQLIPRPARHCWPSITKDLVATFGGIQIRYSKLTETDWANSLRGPKKRAAFEMIEHFEAGRARFNWYPGIECRDVVVGILSMFPKTDEVLSYKDFYGIRPRVIVSTRLEIQYCVQPYVIAATRAFKERLAEGPIIFRGKPYDVTYVAGVDPSYMNAWPFLCFSNAGLGITSILVQGDDSLVYEQGLDGRWRWRETDFSKFDQSQGVPHLLCQYAILRALGVPSSVTSLLMDIAKAPARYKSYGKTEPFVMNWVLAPGSARRATGGADTSLGNSIVAMCAILNCLSFHWSEQSMTDTGLTFKFNRLHETISSATFLHSWWVKGSNNDYAFLPLPSQTVKAGKITKTGLNLQSIREYSRAISTGYINIPVEYPVLGPFLGVMHRLGATPRASRVDYVQRTKPYKVIGQADPNFKLDVFSCRQQIQERYDLTVSDIERAEAKMAAVTSLPWIISDPVFLRLQEIDY